MEFCKFAQSDFRHASAKGTRAARQSRRRGTDDPTTVEVFECCINGQEISPGYTEQNDPIAQRTTLEHQAGGEQFARSAPVLGRTPSPGGRHRHRHRH